METIFVIFYNLAPHSAIELNKTDVALVSTESRGWAIVSIIDYNSIKAFFARNNFINICDLQEKDINTLERLHKLGLVMRDGLYPDYCCKNSSAFPDSLLIKITGQCNFECIYCYDFSDERKENNVSFVRIISIIDQIISKTGKLNIIFHGGEPILRIKTIKDIVDYCRNNYYVRHQRM
jgi:sulfatase maturation enzyme AslB (radical SAM superfamily)